MSQENLKALASSTFAPEIEVKADGRIEVEDKSGHTWRLLKALSGGSEPNIEKVAEGLQTLVNTADFGPLTLDERTLVYGNVAYLQAEALSLSKRVAPKAAETLDRLDKIIETKVRATLPAAFSGAGVTAAAAAEEAKDTAAASWTDYAWRVAPEWLTSTIAAGSSYLTAALTPSAGVKEALSREAIFEQIKTGHLPLDAFASYPESERDGLRCQALQVALCYKNKAATSALAKQILEEGPTVSRNMHLLIFAAYLQTGEREILASLRKQVPLFSVGAAHDFFRGTSPASLEDTSLGFSHGNFGACYMPAAPGDRRMLAGAVLMRLLNEALADREKRAAIADLLVFPEDPKIRALLFQDAWLHKAPALGKELMSPDLVRTASRLLNKQADAKVSAKDLQEMRSALISSLSKKEAAAVLVHRLKLHRAIFYTRGGLLPSGIHAVTLRALMHKVYGDPPIFRKHNAFAQVIYEFVSRPTT